jgi:hypothetical protein
VSTGSQLTTVQQEPRRATKLSVGWAPKGEIDHPHWVRAGLYLGTVERVSQWWIGDWLLYGVAKWGEKYAEAAKITGYDAGSLRNMASMASHFPLSRRRDNLTWCHHAAVASLDEAEQDHWLDRAAEEKLSVADLRLELRYARRAVSEPDEAEEPAASADYSAVEEIRCPHCGKPVPLPRDASIDDTPSALDREPDRRQLTAAA